jgi:nitronate monooxygenase
VGALGCLAGAYLSPSELENAVAKTRSLTHRPFAINLFAPISEPKVSDDQIASALDGTRAYRKELGLPDPKIRPPFHHDFDQQFSVVLRARPALFTFVFGLLDSRYLLECKKEGILTFGTATTLEEGLKLQESGVDGVVAQGVEAGGHRGMFAPDQEDAQIKLLDLTAALAKNLKIPIIASGGMMDGKGMAAALRQGAQLTALGTAFLLCQESGTSKAYKNAILNSKNIPTRLTRVFSGRWARGLENKFMKEMEDQGASLLPFPAQNVLTRDIRTAASQAGKAEYLSLWAGEGVHQTRRAPAADLVLLLLEELEEELRLV